MYNQALLRSIAAHNHNVIPFEALQIGLFIDATRRRICRPQGEEQQRSMYSRRDGHNCCAQVTMGLDGIFIDFFADEVGRHNDRTFLHASGINNRIAACQAHLTPNQQIKGYTDRGYDDDTHVRTAYHGPAPVTAEMAHVNHLLSPERVFEETLFGKMVARNPYLEAEHLQRMQMTPVLMFYRFAALLTNLHTCLHGNLSALHYQVQPPSLADYLS